MKLAHQKLAARFAHRLDLQQTRGRQQNLCVWVGVCVRERSSVACGGGFNPKRNQRARCVVSHTSHLHIVLGDGDVAGVRVVDQLPQGGRIDVVQRDVHAVPLQHVVCAGCRGDGINQSRALRSLPRAD